MEFQQDTFDYSAVDYRDSFTRSFPDPEDRIALCDIAKLFSDPGPKWVQTLFSLRNRIAAWAGLKADVPPQDGRRRIGFFEVFAQSDDSLQMGVDDKHLNVRVRLSLGPLRGGEKQATVTTFVHYNNRLGRVYFFFVKPFHRLIVPALFQRQMRSLISKAAAHE